MFEDGAFKVQGRLADAMRFKVYGDAVYPAPIERVLGLHPAIAEARVCTSNSLNF